MPERAGLRRPWWRPFWLPTAFVCTGVMAFAAITQNWWLMGSAYAANVAVNLVHDRYEKNLHAEFPKGCTCNADDQGRRLAIYVGCPIHD